MTTATLTQSKPRDLYEVDGAVLRYRLHRGQTRAWKSTARFPFVIAGSQAGKTTFGPLWLKREMDTRGPGDYMAVAPTYPLLQKKVLPELKRFFITYLRWGEYRAADRIFVLDGGHTNIFLGHAADPDSLESTTAKGAWMDECGQNKFALSSWEAIQRRLAINQGRALGTTTPYNLGWLKTQVYDRWVAGDPDYDVINFRSIDNPIFPREEYERARRTLPGWKFAMFYQGLFTRPAGMIYDSFDFDRHVIDPFEIPVHWPRYGGLDFGGVNTAAVGYAQNPETGVLYLFTEYHEGGRTAAGHAAALQDWRCRVWVGGSKSEGQWRQEFNAAGLPVQSPEIKDVEVGIDRVYGAHKSGGLFVFRGCREYLDEKGRYARKLGPDGEPTEEIENKNDFHLMDAERYIMGYLRGGDPEPLGVQPAQPSRFQSEQIGATKSGDGSRFKRY